MSTPEYIPEYAMPLIAKVWRACDPVAVTSGPHYKPQFGLPPKTLQIYETSDADWEKVECKRPANRGWIYDGSRFTELSPIVYPDYACRPNGMYWHTGLVEFCFDAMQRRAVYGYVLGPRYARGFKRIFKPSETIKLEAEMRYIAWVS